MGEKSGIGESEFTMWRAAFAFAYADNALSLEEQDLLGLYLKNVHFSYTQREILKSDLMVPKDVVALFRLIQNPADKERFCVLARAIVWCEGDMGEQEKQILRRVSCLKEHKEKSFLQRSRGNPHILDYYQKYAHSGMIGLLKSPPQVLRYA